MRLAAAVALACLACEGAIDLGATPGADAGHTPDARARTQDASAPRPAADAGATDASRPDAPPAPRRDAGAAPPGFAELDPVRARTAFPDLATLQRKVFGPGCAGEANECHYDEDFPDFSSEGNLWNLLLLQCNAGVGDRTTVEDFCEPLGDELRAVARQGGQELLRARVGSIEPRMDAEGKLTGYDVRIDAPVAAAFEGARFEWLRFGTALPALGGGTSLRGVAGERKVVVGDPDHLPDPAQITQGDPNRNGTFGDGGGRIVRPGRARDSYLVRRLFGQGARPRMPLESNGDNPTERNRPLTADEMYAIMSWINCLPEMMAEPYGPIVFDCAANADNRGTW